MEPAREKEIKDLPRYTPAPIKLETALNASMTEFVENIWLPEFRLRNRSWKVDEANWRLHVEPVLGIESVKDLSLEKIENMFSTLKGKNLSPTTCTRIYYTLKSILNTAREKGYYSENYNIPHEFKTPKKANTSEEFLPEELVMTIMEKLRTSQKQEAKAILLMVLTKTRKNQILKAKWKDLLLYENSLFVTNAAGKVQRIWLNTEAVQIINGLSSKGESEWLFPGGDKNKPLSDIFIFWDNLRRKIKVTGIKIKEVKASYIRVLNRKGITAI